MVIQHLQIKQCDTSYQQEKTQEPYDPLSWCKKAFDKVQHPFVIKTFHSVGVVGTYLIIIKPSTQKPQ